MIATRQIDFRANLKKYFDMAFNHEPVIITRKQNKNVVVLSESDFNEYQKLKRNAAYFDKLNKSMKQLENNEVVTLNMKQLEAFEK